MSRNKLKKFAELTALSNVFENADAALPKLTQNGTEEVDMRGKWLSFFKNNNPIVLELACGRGEYSVALGVMYPDKNFIGVDIKGARLYQGAKRALEQNLGNVAFLRTRIEQIEMFFSENEISEIWITFPDPFLNESKSNRRLTSIPFLERYCKFLKKDGTLHLKTDSTELYDFTLETLSAQTRFKLIEYDDNIYAHPLTIPELEVKTYYEKKYLQDGRLIKYIKCNRV